MPNVPCWGTSGRAGAPYEADSVSFDLPRDKEKIAAVIEDASIALGEDAPLPDEQIRPGMTQDEALKQLDPIVAEQIAEDRLPDEIVQDGQAEMAQALIRSWIDIGTSRSGRHTAPRPLQRYRLARAAPAS